MTFDCYIKFCYTFVCDPLPASTAVSTMEAGILTHFYWSIPGAKTGLRTVSTWQTSIQWMNDKSCLNINYWEINLWRHLLFLFIYLLIYLSDFLLFQLVFLTLQKGNGDITTWYLKFYLLKPDLLVVFPTLPIAQAKSLRVILHPLFPPSLQPIH